ncbi:hypothetical protein P43SY_005234 [Pythium insidiosum]|uniref:WW domain-containing protein n=1 Tax=Pythium insidiosum TaxID=114742 RepID=A0AAD5LZA7_PYTIN|nr:hypothetical protein P43SY_005234 [Pythium insidiosum]
MQPGTSGYKARMAMSTPPPRKSVVSPAKPQYLAPLQTYSTSRDQIDASSRSSPDTRATGQDPPLSPHSLREVIALEDFAFEVYRQTRLSSPREKFSPDKRSAAAKKQTAAPPSSRLGAAGLRAPLRDNQRRDAPQRKRQRAGPAEDRGGAINAGVYVLENRKTGHQFLGTTWDLRNAAAQCFEDLADGSHPHRALATCFQLYGADASGIQFRVLERVAPPALRVKPPRPGERAAPAPKPGQDFDVQAMEKLLRRRLALHRRQVVRRCASRLVRRMLIVPLLRAFFLRWLGRAQHERQAERWAASAVCQSAARVWIARRRVQRWRRHRAALTLAKFFRLSACRRVMLKRRERRRRHASASRIQRAMRSFLRRRRVARHVARLREWLGARTIQRVYRGHCGRRVAGALRRERLESAAATTLQRVARGWLARRSVAREQRRRRRWHCATRIQARWRGVLGRQEAHAQRLQRRAMARAHAAARRIQALYWRYVARKFATTAERYARERQHAATIHAAYKNYLAKKFGWAAMTFQLEHTSAVRLQRALHRWWLRLRLRRLVASVREDRAARELQRVARGFCGRRRARREAAARRLQAAWRLFRGLQRLALAWQLWRREHAAVRLQAAARGWQARRAYVTRRERWRRERAAVRIQCFARGVAARREWRRRLEMHRQGLCASCGDAVAEVFSVAAGLATCRACLARFWPTHAADAVELALFRRQSRAVVHVQRVVRGHQARLQRRFGCCLFCEQRATRVVCRAPCRRSFCHRCDALFHDKPGGASGAALGRRAPHDRVRIETHRRQERAAVLLQSHVRRFAQRHTLSQRRRDRLETAAVRVQHAFRGHRRRRRWRSLVVTSAAQHQLEQLATRVLQRALRRFLSRHRARQQQRRHAAAVSIQRVARGHQARTLARQRLAERRAAVVLQRRVRGSLARRVAAGRRAERQQRVQRVAALTLQRRFRGWRARQQVWRERQRRAAVRVQAAWRQRLARRLLSAIRREHLERQRMTREEHTQRVTHAALMRRHAAATRVQTLVRRRLAQRELTRRRLARATERRQRRRLEAVEKEHASATRLQRWLRRRWLAPTGRRRLAAQRLGRRFLARRALQRLRVARDAARRIQRAFRYARVKRKLSRLVTMESSVVAASGGSPWVELFDEESGCVYYYNRETTASTWEKPVELAGEAPAETAAAADGVSPSVGPAPLWVEYWDDSVGTSYYYNTQTGEATWAAPDGVVVPAESGNQAAEEAWAAAQQWPPAAPVAFDPKKTAASASGVAPSNQQEQEQEQEQEQASAYYAYYYPEGVEPNGYAYAYGYDYDYGYGYGYGHEGYYYAEAEPVDTEYDINYKIYLTQLERERVEAESLRAEGAAGQEQRQGQEQLQDQAEDSEQNARHAAT